MTLLDRRRIVVGVPIDSDGRGLGTAEPPSGMELAPGVLSLDIDVLSTAAFGATPYHEDGGLSRDELVALCRPLAHHPACVGMDVKCYDPGMDDAERANGRALAGVIGAILAP